jgi:hypothetical protein
MNKFETGISDYNRQRLGRFDHYCTCGTKLNFPYTSGTTNPQMVCSNCNRRHDIESGRFKQVLVYGEPFETNPQVFY